MLNSAFHQQLSLADEGYESGSNNDLPTPLQKTHCIHHVPSMEHASFKLAHSTPHQPVDSHDTQPAPCRPVCCHLSFSSNQDDHTSPVQMDTSGSQEDSTPEPSDDETSFEEDFPMVPMDDEHWTTELAPDRKLCILENGLPNNVCQHACPYGNNGTTLYIDSLDLSDISDIEDHFLTASDEEELPGLEE